MSESKSTWYITGESEEVIGPVTTQHMLAGIAAGKIPRDTNVCRVGMQTWERIDAVAEFAASFDELTGGEPDAGTADPKPGSPAAEQAGARLPDPGAAERSAPAAPPRARRGAGRLLISAIVAVAVLACGALGARAYQTHASQRACESDEASQRLPACTEACRRGSVPHCVLRAEVLRGLGKVDLAEAGMRETLGANPQASAARIELGRVLQAQAKHAEVVAELSPLLTPSGAVDPAQVSAARLLVGTSQLALGREALDGGKPQNALELLQKSADLAPSAAADAALGTAFCRLKRYEEGAARLEKALEDKTIRDAPTFLALADAYLAQSKDTEAEKALTRAIEAQPKEVTLYTRLAGVHLKAKNTDRAAAVLESYLDQDAKHGEVYATLLGLLEGRKHAGRRRKLLERWRVADPASEDACLRQGEELVGDDTQQAEDALRDCLSTVKAPDKIYMAMVDVLRGRGKRRGDPKKVHAFLDDELAKHPERTVLLDLKAQQYVKDKKNGDAEALLDKAIADHPDEAVPYLAKARFYESVKKAEKVPDLIAVAQQKAPSSRDPAMFALGFHVRRKQFDAVDGDLALLKKLGATDDDVESLREESTFTRADLSCVIVGQGPTSASMDQVIPTSDIHPHQGFWSGDAVQRGYVVNKCNRVTVDVAVDVTFNMTEVTQVFIFVQARQKSSSNSFHFKALKPGEARPFSASTRLGALSLGSSPMGTLGGIGTATRVTGVSVKARVLSPVL